MSQLLNAQDRRLAQRNSLDRRERPRIQKKVEIFTFHNEARLHQSAVIECTEDGARVVLGHPAKENDTVGIIVVCKNRRHRTFARVAWTKKLNPSTTVAGLDFYKLDYSLAG